MSSSFHILSKSGAVPGGEPALVTPVSVLMTLKAQYSYVKAPVTSGTGCYREFIWRL